MKKLAAIGALGLLLTTFGVASAASAEVPAGLSVTISDGLEEVTSGTAAQYTAELRNTGSEPVDARLVVTVPGYVELTAAEGGEIAGADASWVVTVEPGGTATVVADTQIGEIPEGELRMTTLISVYLGEDTAAAPVIRSADANLIEGVTDPSTLAAEPEKTIVDSVPAWLLPVVIGGALLLVVFVVIVLVVRARRVRNGVRGRRGAVD